MSKFSKVFIALKMMMSVYVFCQSLQVTFNHLNLDQSLLTRYLDPTKKRLPWNDLSFLLGRNIFTSSIRVTKYLTSLVYIYSFKGLLLGETIFYKVRNETEHVLILMKVCTTLLSFRQFNSKRN
jgi:hypothetical protein